MPDPAGMSKFEGQLFAIPWGAVHLQWDPEVSMPLEKASQALHS